VLATDHAVQHLGFARFRPMQNNSVR
jgi:hypothetical protein